MIKNGEEMEAAGVEDDSRPRSEVDREDMSGDQFMKITAAQT